jgi:hypothetical protein
VWNKSKIDLEQLSLEIQNLKPTQKLYQVLKDGLTKIDHWKQQKRGKPRRNFNRIEN